MLAEDLPTAEDLVTVEGRMTVEDKVTVQDLVTVDLVTDEDLLRATTCRGSASKTSEGGGVLRDVGRGGCTRSSDISRVS